MKGVALLLLCAVALTQADRPQLSRSGQVCECNSDEAKIFCAHSAPEGAVTSHENCNQFYKCSNGKAISYFCPSALLFNSISKECDWPQNVACGSRPIIDESEVDCSSEEHEEDQPSQEPNIDPVEAPRICAAEGSSGVLVAHKNCNQFYMCTHGVPVTLNCYGNLMYNPFIGKCDWPEDVECGDRPIIDIDNGGDNEGGNGDNGSTETCNCKPGEAPGICAAPDSDGVLVAHEKCNKFYKCDHGVPVALSCPFGLLYNPHIERCDWPHKVNCEDRPIVEIDNTSEESEEVSEGTCNCNPDEAPIICAAPDSNGILIMHKNCNQFYKCDHGVPVTMNCPFGLLYNPHIERCDWPHKVNCGDRPIVEIDNGSDDKDESEEGNGSSEEENEGTCNCKPGEAPGICAAPDSDGVLVAHEKCNKFYKCDHGVPVALSCPFGLLYNPHIERCDWPHKVNCEDRPIVEIDNTSEESEEVSEGTCNCNPDEAPIICAAPDSNGILIMHKNCNQFYKCDHGVPVTMNCPFGLLYNPHIERCDWPHKVNCGDRPIVEIDNGSDDKDESEEGNGNSEEENEGTCNCKPGEAPGICAAPDSDGVLVAHEKCNKFYKCDHGVPVALSCPFGLLYNPHIERCDWPHKVNCEDRPIVEIDNTSEEVSEGTCNCNPDEAPIICAAPDSNGILIMHKNCNQFYKCDHGVPITMNCPFGLLYNPHIERCDWPHKVNCGDRPIVEIDNGSDDKDESSDESEEGNGSSEEENEGTCNCKPGEAPGICAAPNSNGILIMHKNCNQFYKCDHGVPVTMNCPLKLLYNPHTERCDWPHKVNCGDRPIVEIDNGSDDKDESEEGNGSSEEGNGGTCNCKPGEAPGICAAPDSDGVLVAHEKCNKFYKCDHGVPVALSCPFGLLYNPHIERCDWPHKVNCEDRPIVEIDNTSEESEEVSEGTCNCNPDEAPIICAAPDSNGILIMHKNCNQFYKCDHGVPVTMNCPSELLYNPHIERCDWPHKVNCGDRPIVEIDNGSDDKDESSDESEEGNGSSEEGNEGTCNCKPGEAPGICAAPNSNGILIAHEKCNKFYKCGYGSPITMNCNAGLMYNPYTEKCDWPHNVDCGDRPIVEIDNGGETEEENNNDGNSDPSEAPAICATGNSEGVLIAHEECNKFYKCSFGMPVAHACPENLFYNPSIERCDWADSVVCGDRIVTEDKNDSETEDDSASDENNSNSADNCDPSQAPVICAASGSSGILVAHENCNQFYVCTDGSPVALKCPSNLLYSSITRECDWPANVDCGERIIPEVPENEGGECLCNSRQAPGICAEKNSNGKMIAHESCNQFYVCLNGKPIGRSCPNSLLYDPHTKQCDWPSAVNCEERDVSLSFNKHVEARGGLF